MINILENEIKLYFACETLKNSNKIRRVLTYKFSDSESFEFKGWNVMTKNLDDFMSGNTLGSEYTYDFTRTEREARKLLDKVNSLRKEKLNELKIDTEKYDYKVVEVTVKTSTTLNVVIDAEFL